MQGSVAGVKAAVGWGTSLEQSLGEGQQELSILAEQEGPALARRHFQSSGRVTPRGAARVPSGAGESPAPCTPCGVRLPWPPLWDTAGDFGRGGSLEPGVSPPPHCGDEEGDSLLQSQPLAEDTCAWGARGLQELGALDGL